MNLENEGVAVRSELGTYPLVPLGEIARPIARPVAVIPGKSYRTIGVKWWGEGAYERNTIDGSQTAAKTLSVVQEHDLIINKIWVRHGSTAIASREVDGCAASGEFPQFQLDPMRIVPAWIHWLTKTEEFWNACDSLSRGTSGKNRIRPELFLTLTIPLPPLAEQRRIVARIEALAAKIAEARGLRQQAVEEVGTLSSAAAREAFASASCKSTVCAMKGAFRFRNDLIRPTDGVTGTVRFVGLQHVESDTGKRLGEDLVAAETLDGRKFQFSPGEIVYGYLRPYLNKVWVADREGICSVDQYVLCPAESEVDTHYLAHFMRSPSFVEQAKALTNNLMLPRLRSGLLESVEMPRPPLDEQRRIVRYLEDVQAKVDAVRRLQAETAAELDALLPAVLHRAFRGEL